MHFGWREEKKKPGSKKSEKKNKIFVILFFSWVTTGGGLLLRITKKRESRTKRRPFFVRHFLCGGDILFLLGGRGGKYKTKVTPLKKKVHRKKFSFSCREKKKERFERGLSGSFCGFLWAVHFKKKIKN